jgi:signal transduction histidine kinase
VRSSPGLVADARKAALKVASALDRLYGSANIKIDVEVPEDIRIACDPQDLNEILGNVVDNACKHAKSQVRVSMSGTGEAELLTLQVDDDGPGLPPEAFEVVFDVGERWDSRAPGSGLGLTIVRDLARLYGGDVKLSQSEIGGLSVLLSMPAATASAD